MPKTGASVVQTIGRVGCIGIDLYAAALALLAGWQSWRDQPAASRVILVAGGLLLACGLVLTTDRAGAWLAAVWVHGAAMAGLWWARMSASGSVIDPADDGMVLLFAAGLMPGVFLFALWMVGVKRRASDRAFFAGQAGSPRAGESTAKREPAELPEASKPSEPPPDAEKTS